MTNEGLVLARVLDLVADGVEMFETEYGACEALKRRTGGLARAEIAGRQEESLQKYSQAFKAIELIPYDGKEMS